MSSTTDDVIPCPLCKQPLEMLLNGRALCRNAGDRQSAASGCLLWLENAQLHIETWQALHAALCAHEQAVRDEVYQDDAARDEPFRIAATIREQARLTTEIIHSEEREQIAEIVEEFDDWVWCTCSECKANAGSHAVKTEPSLSRLAAKIRQR